MTEHPFRLDPAASFDAEIARVSVELNADVAFRLVEREDGAMSRPCATCSTPTPATHVMIIQKPGFEPARAYVCEQDAKWVGYGRSNPERKPPEGMNPKRVEQLKPLMADKTVQITGHRMPETPDRSPAGGGPGGRPMVPDPPKPPPPAPDRSYPTWDR